MSFGFSIGDFVTIIELANRVRKEFAGAPSQLKNISDEVKSFSIVLQDVDDVLSEHEPNVVQEMDLQEIASNCHRVLMDMKETLDKYGDLQTHGGNLGKRVKRVWKRLEFEPEDIRELRDRLTSNTTLLNIFIGQISSQAAVAARKGIELLSQRQDDHDRLAILDWLTPIDYAAQQSDYNNRRQMGTGRWIVDSPEFQTWLQADKQTLFCLGIPGAGKTIITSFVVHELTSRFRNNKTVGIAYVYCNFRRTHEQRAEDLIASLLKQLSQSRPTLPESVKSLYNNHKEQRTRPSFDEILKALQSVAVLYSKTFIIVDALDECQMADGCRSRFLTEILNLSAKQGVKFFATSRFIPEIMIKISDAVDGMFLLAEIYLSSLEDMLTPKAIRNKLNQLQNQNPGSSESEKLQVLGHAYEQAMERINRQKTGLRKFAIQVLSWITCARRPLSALELQHALAVKIGESELDNENLPQIEDMVSACAGFVTVEQQSGIIRFVHYTTQEYFEQTQIHWFPKAETYITTVCATYLSFGVFKCGYCQSDAEFEERLKANPLFHYAAHNWGHHAFISPQEGGMEAVIEFLRTNPQVEASSQALMIAKQYLGDINYSQEPPRQVTGLHLAAYFGLENAARLLLDTNRADMKDSHGRTPLSYAADNGHEGVVRLLLDIDKAYADSEDTFCRTPLSYAVRKCYKDVLKMLLVTGKVDIISKNKHGRPPLLVTRGGYDKISKLLFEASIKKKHDLLTTQADIVVAISQAFTATKTHQWSFDLQSIQKVLQPKIENFIMDLQIQKSMQTPLLPQVYGLDSCQEAIKLESSVQALMSGKISESSQAPKRIISLYLATFFGIEAVSKLLLEKGADLESEDRYGLTLLSWAALCGRGGVVRLLLDNGVNTDLKDRRCWGLQLWAKWYLYQAIADLLLKMYCDLDAKDKDDWTPLLLAVGKWHKAIIKLLLEKGTDQATNNKNSSTSLLSLVQNRHDVIVHLLVEKGADLESRDSNSWTLVS